MREKIKIKKVLIVEDEEDMRTALVEMLRNEFWIIGEAKNGQEAIEYASTYFIPFEFGIVLLDIKLPDMSGIEVLKKIKDENCNLFVIMLTAMNDTRFIVEAISEGASDYLTKPFKSEDLLSKLRNIYRGETIERNFEFVCKKLDKSQADFERRILLKEQYENKTGQKIPPEYLLSVICPPLEKRLEFEPYEVFEKDILMRLKNKVDLGQRQYSILIVEDEEDMRSGLVEYFGNKYKIFTAANGKEAIKILGENKFDLILLDIRLPDVMGLDLLKKIRSMDKKVCIVMLTAYKDAQTTVDAMNLGANDYITKPFEFIKLSAVIEAHLKLKYHRAKLRLLLDQLRKETVDGVR